MKRLLLVVLLLAVGSFLLPSCSLMSKPAVKASFSVLDLTGQEPYARQVPENMGGCFWTRLENPNMPLSKRLFLCCPGIDAPRPVCQRAQWNGLD